MLQIWGVVFCVVLDTSRCYADQFFLQVHNIWRYRVVRKIPHTNFATCSFKSFLRMDHLSPKHVELTCVMNKLTHKTLCILLDYVYKVLHILSVCLQPQLFSIQSACAVLFVICGLSRSTMFFYSISHGMIFGKEKDVEQEVCVLIFSTNLV